MLNNKIKTCINDTPIPIIKRFKAIVIDSIIVLMVSLLLVVLSMKIISNTNSFKNYNQILETEMLECYRIEEEAKIYEFEGRDDSKYKTPRNQEEIFEDYCLRHILYSYSVDSKAFEQYNVQISNPKKLEIASYENDNLAYFYVNYAAKYNDYNEKINDIVDMEDDPKLHYYKEYKKYAVKIDMWIFDENKYTLPYLDGYFAVDLYKYLFEDSSYQAGLTNYNYLATNYNNLWEVEVGQLVNSSRYKNHYDIYKEYYQKCSYIVDVAVVISYTITFLLAWIIPQLIFKGEKTIGKKIIGITVKKNDGYDLMTHEKILRNVFSYFNMASLLIFTCFLAGGINSGWMYPIIEISGIGISLFSILIILFVISIISFCISIINNKRKSVHDYIMGTICVDDKCITDYETRMKLLDEINKPNEEMYYYNKSKYFDSSSFNNTERKDKYKDR